MKNPINPIKQPTGWLFIDMASALNGNLMEIYWGYRLTGWWFGTMEFYFVIYWEFHHPN
jgi:Zn-dependent protease with chaperone function